MKFYKVLQLIACALVIGTTSNALACSTVHPEDRGSGQSDPQLDSAIAEVRKDITKAYGANDLIHTENRDFTKAPAGYRAFYIWHYNRHGSRYAWNEKTYSRMPVIFQSEMEKDNLTEYGRQLYERMVPFCQKCLPYYGELTEKGWDQLHDIAFQMYESEKSLFKKNPVIESSSSFAYRAIMSEASFCLALKEKDPALDIHESLSRVITYQTLGSAVKNPGVPAQPWLQDRNAFADSTIDIDAIYRRIFKTVPESFDGLDRYQFLLELWIFATGTDSLDFPADFSDVFTENEKIQMAQIEAFHAYQESTADLYKYASILTSIIPSVEETLKEERPHVRLRFGHDTNFIRILRLLGAGQYGREPQNAHATFYCTPISEVPMGANVRLVFYRSRKVDAPVLVKCCLNGREVTLPLDAVSGPFYRYEDLKARIESFPGE